MASIGYFTSGLKHSSIPNAPGHDAEHSGDSAIGKRPPIQDFILTDADGGQKKLSDFRGNVVILSFWASWCAPCLEELPTFAAIEKRFHDKGLRIIALNVEEGPEGKDFAKKFWSAQKFVFPSFFDVSKKAAQLFEVDALPANFVIDRQGRLVFSGFGANDWSDPDTIEFIEDLLQEKDATQSASTGG